MLIVSFGYLFLGAYILHTIDDELSMKPYRNVVLFSFQILTTIGWGDSHPANRHTMAFIVIYTVIGIPIM
jgi:hypothetical protein